MWSTENREQEHLKNHLVNNPNTDRTLRRVPDTHNAGILSRFETKFILKKCNKKWSSGKKFDGSSCTFTLCVRSNQLAEVYENSLRSEITNDLQTAIYKFPFHMKYRTFESIFNAFQKLWLCINWLWGVTGWFDVNEMMIHQNRRKML